MPDITAIAQAFGALKAMKDIAEATIGLRDAAAFRERQIEFQGKIIDAQNALFALQDDRSSLIERIGTLEAKIAGLKAWDAEKDRYQLTEVAPRVFAYVLKPDASSAEPSHWICPACYQSGKNRFCKALMI